MIIAHDRGALLRRGAVIVAFCATVTACGSLPSGDDPEGRELSPQFLDMLAPVDGDSGARARESAALLLAGAEADAVADCMADNGFAEYAELPVLNAQDRNAVHPEFVSPTKLETRGLVSIGDPDLEDVPAAAQSALSTCLGETGARSVSELTDRFIVFRDGAENPFSAWPKTVRAEVTRIAESDDPSTAAYRECFRELGVPADVADSPTDAVGWLISEMNDRTNDFPSELIEAWKRGEGILDADGGAVARQTAACFREFEALLTPRLTELRDATLDENRERLTEGQALFYKAIGSDAFDPEGYDF